MKRLLIHIAIIILISAVIISLFVFVYTPYYDSERTRLLTFTMDCVPAHLDPANVADTDSETVVLNIFDTLVRYKQGSTEIEPSLATNWEILNFTTYIFYLRSDVTFQDGTPLNATSVKYSLDRASQLSSISYVFSHINNTQVLDTYTVQITLNEGFAPLLQILAHPAASIVSETAIEKYGDTYFDTHPVGSGPFKFDHWNSQELVLTANKNYFRGSPNFETVVCKSTLEAAQRETDLLNGRYDGIFDCPPTLPAQDLANLEKNPDLRVSKAAGLDLEFLCFNTQKAPLNDSRIREAIAYAIDYDSIINNVMNGYAERIGGAVPPGIFGYSNISLIQSDKTKAIQLLTDAGYPNGFNTTITYNNDNLARHQIAYAIKDSLSEIGIRVTPIGLDWGDALDAYFSLNYDMGLNDWSPDYFDADAYLTPLFHSGQETNICGFSNSQVDTLLDHALTTTSASERLSDYSEVQQIIANQLPMVFLYVPEVCDFTRYNVAGWIHSPTSFISIYSMYRL